MNCKCINALMFAAGAVIGSAVTWKVVKTEYERITREEIESVKEAFANMASNAETSEADESEDEEEEEAQVRPHQINWDELEDLDESELEDISDAAEEYAQLTNLYSNEKGGAEKMEKSRPYVISPFDFGEEDGYSQIELTYYSDGILEDDSHEIMSDSEIDELIGLDSLQTFGRYEEDSVFVRNDWLRTDFEILKDPRTYEKATGKSPKRVGNE